MKEDNIVIYRMSVTQILAGSISIEDTGYPMSAYFNRCIVTYGTCVCFSELDSRQ